MGENKDDVYSGPGNTCEDPFQILTNKTKVSAFSGVLFMCRLVSRLDTQAGLLCTDTAGWSYIHVWAEDYYNAAWVHVDPSDAVWNNPSRYQSWGWGTFGSQVQVFAFKDGFQKRHQHVCTSLR